MEGPRVRARTEDTMEAVNKPLARSTSRGWFARLRPSLETALALCPELLRNGGIEAHLRLVSERNREAGASSPSDGVTIAPRAMAAITAAGSKGKRNEASER